MQKWILFTDTILNNSKIVLEPNRKNHKETEIDQFHHEFPWRLQSSLVRFSHGKRNQERLQGAGRWRCQVAGRRPTRSTPRQALRRHNETGPRRHPGSAPKPPRQPARDCPRQPRQLQVTSEPGTWFVPWLLEKRVTWYFIQQAHTPLAPVNSSHLLAAPAALEGAVRLRLPAIQSRVPCRLALKVTWEKTRAHVAGGTLALASRKSPRWPHVPVMALVFPFYIYFSVF